MTARRIDAFFYGLFMDADVLRQAGTKPTNFRRACVEDLALRIGQRATLVQCPDSRAYGMVVSLTHAELQHLYAGPGLDAYRPEAVIARSLDGEPIPALCYNLVEPPEPQDCNPEYAARLRQVLERLGFPEAYVRAIG